MQPACTPVATPKYYYYYYYYYYYWYSVLGPVLAETRVQSGDWYGSGTLHPGQLLRDGLPLLSPAFTRSKFRHQVPPRPPRRERSQRRKWELWARMLSGNFAEMKTSTPCRDLLHAVTLRHGTDGFTSPPPSIQKLKYQIRLQQYDMPNNTYSCWLSIV